MWVGVQNVFDRQSERVKRNERYVCVCVCVWVCGRERKKLHLLISISELKLNKECLFERLVLQFFPTSCKLPDGMAMRFMVLTFTCA